MFGIASIIRARRLTVTGPRASLPNHYPLVEWFEIHMQNILSFQVAMMRTACRPGDCATLQANIGPTCSVGIALIQNCKHLRLDVIFILLYMILSTEMLEIRVLSLHLIRRSPPSLETQKVITMRTASNCDIEGSSRSWGRGGEAVSKLARPRSHVIVEAANFRQEIPMSHDLEILAQRPEPH